jgi:hypothetical protein
LPSVIFRVDPSRITTSRESKHILNVINIAADYGKR